MNLKDVDNNVLIDIAGSYGVNVCGYDLYKKFLNQGIKKVGNLGPVLGPLHPVLKENIQMLQEVAQKPDGEVSFHMSVLRQSCVLQGSLIQQKTQNGCCF